MNEKMVRNKHNTPMIIKYPFWQMTYESPKAVYACLNQGEAFAPREIAERAVCMCEEVIPIDQRNCFIPCNLI